MPGNGYQKHNKSKNTPREVLAVTDLRRFNADIIKRTKDSMSRLDKLEQAGQRGVVFVQNDVGKKPALETNSPKPVSNQPEPLLRAKRRFQILMAL